MWLPHIAFCRNYLKQLRAMLPLPTVLPMAGGSPDAACSTLPCAAESPDVVCASPRLSRRAIRRRWPVRVMDLPVLTVQDPLAAAGALVLSSPVVAGVDGHKCCGRVGDSGFGCVRRGCSLSSRT